MNKQVEGSPIYGKRKLFSFAACIAVVATTVSAMAVSVAARADGANPEAGLVQASNGMLYGTTRFGGKTTDNGIIFTETPDKSFYKVLHNFGETATDGTNPTSAVMIGLDGLLYGTTIFGGVNGAGVVYKMKLDGTGYKVIYNFGATATDGQSPFAGLVQAATGVLYGTCESGGKNFIGTVFKLKTDGTAYKTLHAFAGAADGSEVLAGLALGTDGQLYGTTYMGGLHNGGTLFRLHVDGTNFKVLHHFGAANDGFNSSAAPLEGADGTLYGTCEGGGNGAGTIYNIELAGTSYATIHNFASGATGFSRKSPLIQGSTSLLFGAVQDGGTFGDGTIFSMNADGTGFKTLHNFGNSATDGTSPDSILFQGLDDRIYGTTEDQGSRGDFGTVFAIKPAGTSYTTLHDFGGEPA